jgi:hypothetical protein
MTGQAFRTDLAAMLVPTHQPGDTVVIDNLPTHNVIGVRERIEAAGARSGYTPIDRPIGDRQAAFTKRKALLRGAGRETIPYLWEAIRRSLTRFAPADCRACLAAAGYAAT